MVNSEVPPIRTVSMARNQKRIADGTLSAQAGDPSTHGRLIQKWRLQAVVRPVVIHQPLAA